MTTKRDEEIEAAAIELAELEQGDFKNGAKWADANPPPELTVLVDALRFYAGCPALTSHDKMSFDSGSFQNDRGNIARESLANFKKSRGE